MMLRLPPGAVVIISFVVLALAACVRQGPPAPVDLVGSAPQAGASAENVAPNRDAFPAAPVIYQRKPASLVAVPTEAPQSVAAASPGMATSPGMAAPRNGLPVAVVQTHPPHPDRVTVAKGETLYMVSRRYDVPLRSIIDANNLNPPYRLDAGTTLSLPQQRFHLVQPGDTLYSISRAYGVEVSALVRLNHLSAPYGIRTGEALQLPPTIERPEVTVAAAPGAGSAGIAPPKPAEEAALEVPPAAAASAGKPFIWPLRGRIIGDYGVGPNGTHNDGINIAARLGEPVRAADSGVVAYAGNELRGYGNLVLIKHPGGYMTAYAHNAKILVRRGEAVKRGQEIATAGETGGVGTPQLHFEIRRGTRALNPIDLLPALKASID